MFRSVMVGISILLLCACAPTIGQDDPQLHEQYRACVSSLNREDIRRSLQETYTLLSSEREGNSKGNAYFLAGWIHQYTQAQGTKADFNFSRLLNQYPQHPLSAIARLNSADNLLLQGDFQKARIEYALLEEYFPELSGRDDLQYKTALCNYYSVRLDDCITDLQRLLLRYPKSGLVPQSMYLLALCYERKGDKPKARDALKRLVEGYPKSGYATRENGISQVK